MSGTRAPSSTGSGKKHSEDAPIEQKLCKGGLRHPVVPRRRNHKEEWHKGIAAWRRAATARRLAAQ